MAGARANGRLVGVCAIDEYENGTIKRHELTRAEKEQDRVEHMRALGCQTGPIFLTYRDEPVLDIIVGAAKEGSPLYAFTDDADVRQIIWEVARPEAIEAIHAMFERIPCAYIADGHHRTASAVRVAQELRKAARANGTYTGTEPFNFFLSVLFPASQLTILPYNRVVADRAGLTAAELATRIEEEGFIAEQSPCAVKPEQPEIFGMFAEGRWWKLSLGAALAAEVSAGDAVERLDASVLQKRVLAPILGVGDVREEPAHLVRGRYPGNGRAREASRRGRRRVRAPCDGHRSAARRGRCGTPYAAEIHLVRTEAQKRPLHPPYLKIKCSAPGAERITSHLCGSGR